MAHLLSGVVSLTDAIDEQFLYCSDGAGGVILEAPDNGGIDILERLGPTLTLGGILCTLFNHLLAGHYELDVHICPPC